MSPTIRVVTARALGSAVTAGLLAVGLVGCGGSSSAVSACTLQVDRGASSSDHDPGTVRYAKILEACPSFVAVDHALRTKGGNEDALQAEEQMADICRQLTPVPKGCVGLPGHGGG